MPPVLRPARYMPPWVQCTLLRCSLLSISGPVVLARIEDAALEAELLRLDVHRPGEFLAVEVEAEDAVEAGRSQEQGPLPDRDLVAMLEIGIAPGAEPAEVRRVGEELVARGDVDDLAVEGDAAQAAIPAAALPVDVGRVPVDDLADLAPVEVDQVDAAMALALVAAAHHRGRDELQRSGPRQAAAVTISW